MPASAAGRGRVSEQAEAQRAQIEKIWAQRLERAEFAVERARRQYQLAEPENRLVVRQLEKDWEAALAERELLVREHEQFLAARPRLLSQAERDQIRVLAQDIPAIWNAPSTTMADRKQLTCSSSRCASRCTASARRPMSKSPGPVGTSPRRRSCGP